MAVNVASGDLGELFEYRFSSPVTVKKDESAMLPFLQQPIGARKLLIYSENYGEHPMNAAELTNSTGKTLDGGPITVFDAASYAGEALMTTLKTGDKRLISYAVDLGTRVTTQFDSSRELVREIHVNRGMLTARLALDETKTYTIRNVDQKAKTLIIEHPERPGYKLIAQKPAETTANAYRFEVKLGADATEKFPVAEERVYDTTTSVSSLTPDVLLTYIQNKAMSEAARRQLQQIVDSEAADCRSGQPDPAARRRHQRHCERSEPHPAEHPKPEPGERRSRTRFKNMRANWPLRKARWPVRATAWPILRNRKPRTNRS